MKALDTTTVALQDRLVKLCEVLFFLDAAIAGFSELQIRLGTNSKIVEANEFETGVPKIRLNHRSQLIDEKQNAMEALRVVQ